MKRELLLPGLLLTVPVAVLVSTPAGAQVIQVTDVQFNQTPNGLEVILETSAGASPQTFTSSVGDNLIIDIANAKLKLPQGDTWRRENPAPGITSVVLTQVDANNIRLTVMGDTQLPTAEVRSTAAGLVVNLTAAPEAVAQPPLTTAAEPVEEEIELVVTATRTEQEVTDVPRSITVITRQQIEQQQNVARDLQDILGQLVPGLAPPSQLFTSFGQNLRGRRPLVLIDGVPITTNLSTAYARDLRTIDPSAVERVEVVRGPSAIYGDGGAGGVINIITRRATRNEFRATTEAGVNLSLTHPGDSVGYEIKQFVSGRQDRLDYAANVSFESTGYFFDAGGDRIPFGDAGPENVRTFNILAKAGYNFTPEQRLQFTFNYYRDTQEINYISDPSVDDIPGRQKARALRREIQFEDTEGPANLNTIANLVYTHQNILGSRVEAQAYYRDTTNRGSFFDSRTFDPDSFVDVARSRQETSRYGGRLQIETSFLENLRLLWGTDYVREDIEQPFDIFDTELFDRTGGQRLRKVNEGIFTPSYQVRSLGLFSQLQWDATDRLLLSGGVRHERIGMSVDDFTLAETNESVRGGELDFSATVFNAGVVYKITNELNTFLNFSQGFSVPDFGRILRRPPDGFVSVTQDLQILEPIAVDNYEIGVRGEWRNVQASIAGFYNTSDLGATLRTTAIGALEVVRAPQRNYGVEATVDYSPGRGWQIGGTVSYVVGENDADEDGDYITLDSSEVSPIKVTAYVQHQTTPGWLNRLQLLYVGSRDDAFKAGLEGAPIESYFVLDYISNIRLGPGELQIGVQNLLNQQYASVTNQWIGGFGDQYYLASPGTTLSLNYRYNW